MSEETKKIELPIKELDNEKWILLKTMSPSWKVRAYNFGEIHNAKDPSDHRLNQMRATTSVKCAPNRDWDWKTYRDKLTKERKRDENKKEKGTR